MGDPPTLAAVDATAFLTTLPIIPGIAPPSRIRRAIEQAYQIPAAPFEDVLTEAESKLPKFEIVGSGEAEPALDLVELRSVSDQAPIVRLVDMLLMDAIRRRASDIHLEPFEGAFRVRFRIDGVLQQIMTPPKRLAPAITSRIKIMADLDRKSTRLNSSHSQISYAVFCLKKQNTILGNPRHARPACLSEFSLPVSSLVDVATILTRSRLGRHFLPRRLYTMQWLRPRHRRI